MFPPSDFHTITLPVFALEPNTADEVYGAVAGFLKGTKVGVGQSVNLNLKNLEFCNPYGMISLWIASRMLQQKGLHVTISIPNFHVQHYMERIGLFHILEEDGVGLLHRMTNSVPFHRDSDVLLELTRIGHGDSLDVVQKIVTRVSKMLQINLKFRPADVANVCTLLTETCLNVIDHSGGQGLAAAQRYTKKDGRKFVIISVGDNGMGIRNSLALRFPEAHAWSDAEAIARSLEKSFSRLPERGLGLYHVANLVTKYDGSLQVRTGGSRIRIQKYRTRFASPFVPGTQIFISVSTS